MNIKKLRTKQREGLYLSNFVLLYNPDVIHVHDLPQLKAGCLAKNKTPAFVNPLLFNTFKFFSIIFLSNVNEIFASLK